MPLRRLREDEEPQVDPRVDSSVVPQSIINPFFTPRENEADKPIPEQQLDDIDNPDASHALRVLEGDGSTQNTAQAKQLLESGAYTSGAHKRRLERIVEVGNRTERSNFLAKQMDSAEGRRGIQERLNIQFRALVKAGADPKNPMTIAEVDSVGKQLQQQSIGELMANPIQVYKRELESDNPILAVTNAGASIQNIYNGTASKSDFEAVATGMLDFDPETKAVTGASMARSLTAMGVLTRGDPKAQSAVARSLSQTRRDIDQLKNDSPILFDKNLTRKDRPVAPTTFGSEYLGAFGDGRADGDLAQEQADYDADATRLAQLEAKEAGLIADQDRFAGIGAPKTTPPPEAPPETQDLQTLAEGGTINIEGLTKQKPVRFKAGDDPQTVFQEAAANAKKNNKGSFFYVDPSTQKIMEVTL